MLTLTTASPTSAAIAWGGGEGVLYGSGTWGSGTLTLTWCESADGTFMTIGKVADGGVTITANESTGFKMPVGFVKATLSGSSGATVNWNVARANGLDR